MNWSIGKKIISGYCIALLLLVVVGTASFLSVRELIATEKAQDHAREVLTLIEQLQLHLLDAESSQRGYIITSREEHLTHYTNALDALTATRGRLVPELAGSSEQTERLVRLERLVDERLARMVSALRAMKERGTEAGLEAVSTNQGGSIMDQVRLIATEMYSEELRAGRRRPLSRSRLRVPGGRRRAPVSPRPESAGRRPGGSSRVGSRKTPTAP
jgi:methyl-accepting chemotaxis protein